MKLGLISDVHGNIDALNTVLEKLEKENIDKILCMGDLIGDTPRSDEVVQKIKSLGSKIITVRGNRERYAVEGMPKFVHDEKIKVSDRQIAKNDWMRNSLSDSSMEFIKELPKEMYFNAENKVIYFAHYPMKKDGNFRVHIPKATAEENEKMFEGINADIYLYGHTHIEVYNKKDGKVYINPGALGCPENTNKAPYGILKIDGENVEYNQLYAEYDVQKVIEDIRKSEFPGYKGSLRLFYGVDE